MSLSRVQATGLALVNLACREIYEGGFESGDGVVQHVLIMIHCCGVTFDYRARLKLDWLIFLEWQ